MKSFMDKLKDMLPGSDKEENEAEKADAGTARSAPDPAAEPDGDDRPESGEKTVAAEVVPVPDANETAATSSATADHLTIRVDYAEEEARKETAPVSQRDILAARVLECLKARKFRYTILRDDEKLFHVTMNMVMTGKLSSCVVHVFANPTDIEAVCVCPIKATEDVRSQVAEYITRANCMLKFGSFRLDYRSGEVRFACALSAMEGTPSLRDVDRTIAIPFLMMNRYGDGLVKNLMGYGNPEEDLAAILSQPVK